MNIRLDKLKGRPREIVFSEPATEFPALRELVEQGSLRFAAPVSGALVATWAGDVIEVAGRLTTRVEVPCSRCLDEVSSSLSIDVLLCYTRTHPDEAKHADVEVELDAADLGLIPVSEDELDLHPEIEQEIIMAIPQRLLCKDTCAGLCPVCGTNLNRSACRCERPVFHAGLAALKAFKSEK